MYSGKCRALAASEAETRAAAGESFAVRLAVPDAPLRFHDIVRGDVEFASDTVSDFILVRSTGVPVYNYVVTIDDALMQITHVIRGDDHISNTPRQVAIYQAFGWQLPQFAHLSTILGSDRERLSKRHGATSVASFREMGILPQALANYLALLGWGAEGGTRETFTREELIAEFKLERVTPSPAVFDWDKLHWLNRHVIKQTPLPELRALSWPYFVALHRLPPLPAAAIEAWFDRVLELFLPAVDQLQQLPEKAAALWSPPPVNQEDAALLASEAGERVVRAFTAKILAEARRFDAPALQGADERGEGRDRRQGQRPLPPRTHPPDRSPLRPGVRQTDPSVRRRQPARFADPRVERAGACRSLSRIQRQ